MDAGWLRALEPVRAELDHVLAAVEAERAAGCEVLPARERVLRAFEQSFDRVRVAIIGQDPYPTPGHAVGLAFSVAAEVWPIPASLRNIFSEYCDDLGFPVPSSGDLSAWADQGVLLLNRTLTVRSGAVGSHAGIGWQTVTAHAIAALAGRGTPLVGVLWGAHAAAAEPLFGDWPTIRSPHPSPLSAYRGFFGSKPFTGVNRELERLGALPIDWRLA